MEGISNIEQGILNDEVEIAAVTSLLRNDFMKARASCCG